MGSTAYQRLEDCVGRAKRMATSDATKAAAFFAGTGTAAYAAATALTRAAAEKPRATWSYTMELNGYSGSISGYRQQCTTGQFTLTAGLIWSVLAAGIALYFKTRPPKEDPRAQKE
ncbi:hypothetical protein HY642_00520 [Candidatus Woesearchaeota archaeon]|nr:hypothetical protein [Candidatus Woesearchaeota archaeon]